MSELIAAIEAEIYKPLAEAEKLNEMSWYRNGLRTAIEIIRQHEERAEKKHSYPEQNVPYFNPAIPPIHVCKHCGKK